MPYISLNPATGETLKTFTSWDSQRLASALEQAYDAQRAWAATNFPERAERMNRVAALLDERVNEYAALMAMEMGKRICTKCFQMPLRRRRRLANTRTR